MARNDSPFDMQIKLLMIGDSGKYSVLLSVEALTPVCSTHGLSHLSSTDVAL